MMTNHPSIVEAFMRASLIGWARYKASNGEDVHAHLQTLNPQQTTEFAAWTKDAISRYELIDGFMEQGEALGRFDRERLQKQLVQLELIELIDKQLILDEVVAFDLQGLLPLDDKLDY